MGGLGLRPLFGAGSWRRLALLTLALAGGCAKGRATAPDTAWVADRVAAAASNADLAARADPSVIQSGAVGRTEAWAEEGVDVPRPLREGRRPPLEPPEDPRHRRPPRVPPVESPPRRPPLDPPLKPRQGDAPATDEEELFRQLKVRAMRLYGEDDRAETAPGVTAELADHAAKVPRRVSTPTDWAEAVLQASRSVCLMVLWSELEPHADGSFLLPNVTYDDRVRAARGVPLCPLPDAQYHQQPTAGLCTAWLAAPDLVVTAKHCVMGREATEFGFVFGWQKRDGGFPGTPAQLESAQVYQGGAFLALGANHEAGDYAVIRLQRAVPLTPERAPLVMRRSGRPQPGEALYLLGCPQGLPIKFAGGAQVKLVHSHLPLLRADVDAFHGNSGSPVLSALDHRVVGILVRGKSDFFVVGDPPCAVEARTEFTRGGETVLGCPAFERHIPRTAADGR